MDTAPSRESHYVLIVIFGLCLGMSVVLEIANLGQAGGALQSYHWEYAEGGSKKWRGSFGNAFHARILMPAVLVYPLAAVAAVHGALIALTGKRTKRTRITAGAIALAACLIVVRFVSLGVFTAAFEL